MTWQPPEPTAWQVEFLITEIWVPLGNPQRDKSRAEALANNPKVPKECQRVIPFYTHDQLLAVRREAIEECAKKCEEMKNDGNKYLKPQSDLLTTAAAASEPVTYSSTQATTCAGCLKHKHTPLRIDAMGGYVCLTCIEQKLGSLLGEFGHPEPATQQPDVVMHCDLNTWTINNPPPKGSGDVGLYYAPAAVSEPVGEQIHVGDSPSWEDAFEAWWASPGQYCRAGGGNYEKTFAFRAWEAGHKAAPPAEAKPLTEARIEELNCISIDRVDYDIFEVEKESVIDFARAIEKAHNIGAKEQ